MTLGPDQSLPAVPRARENRRREIIEAAFELFAERGYRGGSLDQVAQRVGLTKAGLLHYFSSKEALLIAVLAERDRYSASVAVRASEAADPLELRLKALQALVAHNASQRGLIQAFTVLSAESVTEDHPAQEFFRQRYRAGRERLAEVVTTAGRELSEDDARRAAALLLAVMDGLQLQWLLDPEEVDMGDAFNFFAALFVQLGATRSEAAPAD